MKKALMEVVPMYHTQEEVNEAVGTADDGFSRVEAAVKVASVS